MANDPTSAGGRCEDLCLSDRVRKWIDLVSYSIAVVSGVYGGLIQAGLREGPMVVSGAKDPVRINVSDYCFSDRFQPQRFPEFCEGVRPLLDQPIMEPNGTPFFLLGGIAIGFSLFLNVGIGISNRRVVTNNYYCKDCDSSDSPKGSIVQVASGNSVDD